MSARDALSYLGLWGLIGSAVFSVFVVLLFRSGIVYAARKEDGTLKERIPIRGYASMVGFLFCIVGFELVANHFGLARRGITVGFGTLFLLNLVLYLILFAYDTIVVDGLVLGHWRPGFLRVPDAMGPDSMKEHMRKSLPVGTVFGILLSLVSTVISFYAIM